MRFIPVLAGLMLGAMVAAATAAPAKAPAAPAAAPAQAAPQTDGGIGAPTDTKTVGDWSVRCYAVNSASPCDMYEELADRATRQRVLGVSIAYIPSSDHHAIQIAVPLGIAIANGVVIQADNYTSPVMKYRRCDRAGCYVEALIDNAVVDKLAHAGPNGTVKIMANNNKPFALRISFNGFAGAHDAMMELARQKAKAPPAAAAPAK